MIEWMLWGLIAALAGSLAGLVWAARRAILAIPAPVTSAPSRRVAVIVPVAGLGEPIEASIHSLLNQTHSSFEVVVVLRDAEDPAAAAVQAAIRGKAAATCVFAGPAMACGQKNHNLLAGVAEVGDRAEVLVFADAGHVFPAGWLDRLVAPIGRGEAEVTSGYHAVRPANGKFVPWIYAACVEMMHVTQNAPGLRQPWGGAMAISRPTFERLKVADTWRTSVVDDVSLARVLRAHRVKVLLVPLLRLETSVATLNLHDLFEWLVRQLQYIRFIFPGSWILMGLWGLLQIAALGAAAVLVVMGTVSLASVLLLAALDLAVLAVLLLQIRLLHPVPCPPVRWLAASAVSLLILCAAHAAAGLRREIRWRGICYQVKSGGRVVEIRHPGSLIRAERAGA